MSNQPLISVIVPIYKAEKYLSVCVESILKQTYRNLEIILVDDASPDMCPQICDEYAANDDRIIVIHKDNGGVAEARNAGLRAARGELIGFVDADDWLAPEMYAILYDNMLKEDADISAGGIIDCTGNQRIARLKDYFYLAGNTEEGLIYINAIKYMGRSVWDKLYRRELFDDVSFPPNFYVEDMAVTYAVFVKSKKFVFDSTPCYYYRHLEGSRSKNSEIVDVETPKYFYNKYYGVRAQYPKAAPYMLFVNFLSYMRVYEASLRSRDSEKYKNYRKSTREIIRNNWKYIVDGVSDQILKISFSQKLQFILLAYFPLLFHAAYRLYRFTKAR